MSKSLLMEFVEQGKMTVKKPEMLPLFHSCEVYDGGKIAKSGYLEARHCKEFDMNLLYFFYGKPAYAAGEKNVKNRTDNFYCPCCFVVNPEKVPFFRVFPFDTGAFQGKRYEDFIHRHMKIENYELENNIDAILEYISVFYETNEDYLKGECKQSESNVMEIKALLNMLNAKGAFEIDERANTIEVICDKNLKLAEVVECIILPRDLLKDVVVSNFIKNNGIKYKTYNIRQLTPPDRYNEAVVQLAMQYLDER